MHTRRVYALSSLHIMIPSVTTFAAPIDGHAAHVRSVEQLLLHEERSTKLHTAQRTSPFVAKAPLCLQGCGLTCTNSNDHHCLDSA